jgi:hypothetical protein
MERHDDELNSTIAECLFSGLENCHQITSDTTIEFAISGGLKARKVIAWAEASHASEAQVESTHET